MYNLKEIIEAIEVIAPLTLAEDWDNVGLQIGSFDRKITRVLLALEVKLETIKEAKSIGAELIITHHPIIFKPISSFNFSFYPVSLIKELIKADIAVYSAHTNLDKAHGGVNDTLAQIVGLGEVTSYPQVGGTIKIGKLKKVITFLDFIKSLKEKLNLKVIRFRGEGKEFVQKVALCAGSGSSLIRDVISAEAEVFCTGELNYHAFLEADESGLKIIEIGHRESETPILYRIKLYLKTLFPQLKISVSKESHYLYNYYCLKKINHHKEGK